jgi:hypothetical protein
LTDVSHVIMDFAGFLALSKSMIRLYAVIGRILVIFADYLPDHSIRPEELAIQIFLLSVSLNEVLKPLLSLEQDADKQDENKTRS